jgi:MFS family permease
MSNGPNVLDTSQRQFNPCPENGIMPLKKIPLVSPKKNATPTGQARPKSWCDLPTSIWILGFVSLLMDISSELIHGLLPLFVVNVIGASALTLGEIEGLAEATASVAKVFSGVLSDKIGKRKLLTAFGYALSAVTKPVFPLASSAGEILAARFVDRIGKGVRDAPRDALIADITPAEIRGVSYGVRLALDQTGAFLGPLLAIFLMWLYANDFRSVFWWATLPAGLAVLLVVFGVQEPDNVKVLNNSGWPIQRKDLARLKMDYWMVVTVGVVFNFARFSEAFLVLKAQTAGLSVALAPMVFVCLNLVSASVATPAGIISDIIGRKGLLLSGLIALVIADLVLAHLPGLYGVFIGVGFWGLSLGLSQGILSALIADTAPEDLRGTAFGVFNLLTGGALLMASVVAGWLWQNSGPATTFLAGAAFATMAVALLALSTTLNMGKKKVSEP